MKQLKRVKQAEQQGCIIWGGNIGKEESLLISKKYHYGRQENRSNRRIGTKLYYALNRRIFGQMEINVEVKLKMYNIILPSIVRKWKLSNTREEWEQS